MQSLTQIAVVVVALVVVLGVVGLIAARLGMLKARPGSGTDDEPTGEQPPMPYRSKSRLLSPAEVMFLEALRPACPLLAALAGKDAAPIVLCLVRLADVLEVSGSGSAGAAKSAMNRIDRKHLDFVLCDPLTTRPLVAIELDDASHKRADRQERDRFLDRAMEAARLPIVHVRAAGSYEPKAIAQRLFDAMATVARTSA